MLISHRMVSAVLFIWHSRAANCSLHARILVQATIYRNLYQNPLSFFFEKGKKNLLKIIGVFL